MTIRKARTVVVAFGLLLAFGALTVGWAQPAAPPQQEQPAPGTMGPGMMRGPMMPMMGDMNRMMQMCTQMMNQMMGAGTPPAPSAQGSSPGK